MYFEDLQSVLMTEQRQAGFHLEEDDHFLYLYNREGKNIAVFSSGGATVSTIRSEVELLMKK